MDIIIQLEYKSFDFWDNKDKIFIDHININDQYKNNFQGSDSLAITKNNYYIKNNTITQNNNES